MTFLNIFILSLVQGITEFLPISSSTHLAIASKLFSISEFSFSLKIALHVGSLVALLIYFRKAIWQIILSLFTKRVKLSNTAFWLIVLGTLPTVIIGLLFHDFVKNLDSDVMCVGTMLISFGISLYSCDKFCETKTQNQYIRSLLIGLFQTIAILPGVSRLGICITAGRITGLNRNDAIQISMLLAIPAIFGSLVLELIKVDNIKLLINSDALIGATLTSIIGILALTSCTRYMKRNGFKLLMWYRIILGLVLILFK